MLPYDQLMALPPRVDYASISKKDAIIYALGLGVGAEHPWEDEELKFTYEKNLEVIPTMAVVVGSPGFFLREPKYQVDWRRLLHGEQRLTLHRPLPAEGDVKSVLTLDEVYDKGPEKGALLLSTRKIYERASGDLLATVGSTSFLRGDGGCGGRTDKAPPPPPIPHREADLKIAVKTRRDQALLYRLSGDFNPLHIDPDIARSAGFERPILHGLCTYGIVGLVLLRALCDGDPGRFRHLDVRFSRPVYPGDEIAVELWREGAGRAAVRASVPKRNEIVINNGSAGFTE